MRFVGMGKTSMAVVVVLGAAMLAGWFLLDFSAGSKGLPGLSSSSRDPILRASSSTQEVTTLGSAGHLRVPASTAASAVAASSAASTVAAAAAATSPGSASAAAEAEAAAAAVAAASSVSMKDLPKPPSLTEMLGRLLPPALASDPEVVLQFIVWQGAFTRQALAWNRRFATEWGREKDVLLHVALDAQAYAVAVAQGFDVTTASCALGDCDSPLPVEPAKVEMPAHDYVLRAALAVGAEAASMGVRSFFSHARWGVWLVHPLSYDISTCNLDPKWTACLGRKSLQAGLLANRPTKGDGEPEFEQVEVDRPLAQAYPADLVVPLTSEMNAVMLYLGMGGGKNVAAWLRFALDTLDACKAKAAPISDLAALKDLLHGSGSLVAKACDLEDSSATKTTSKGKGGSRGSSKESVSTVMFPFTQFENQSSRRLKFPLPWQIRARLPEVTSTYVGEELMDEYMRFYENLVPAPLNMTGIGGDDIAEANMKKFQPTAEEVIKARGGVRFGGIPNSKSLSDALVEAAGDEGMVIITLWTGSYAPAAKMWELRMLKLGHKNTLHVLMNREAPIAEEYGMRYLPVTRLTREFEPDVPLHQYDRVKVFLPMIAVKAGIHVVFAEMDIVWFSDILKFPAHKSTDSVNFRPGAPPIPAAGPSLGDFDNWGDIDLRVLGHSCQYEVNVGMMIYRATPRTYKFLKNYVDVRNAEDSCLKVLDQKMFTALLPPGPNAYGDTNVKMPQEYAGLREACKLSDEPIEVKWDALNTAEFAGPCHMGRLGFEYGKFPISNIGAAHYAFISLPVKLMLIARANFVANAQIDAGGV